MNAVNANPPKIKTPVLDSLITTYGEGKGREYQEAIIAKVVRNDEPHSNVRESSEILANNILNDRSNPHHSPERVLDHLVKEASRAKSSHAERAVASKAGNGHAL